MRYSPIVYAQSAKKAFCIFLASMYSNPKNTRFFLITRIFNGPSRKTVIANNPQSCFLSFKYMFSICISGKRSYQTNLEKGGKTCSKYSTTIELSCCSNLVSNISCAQSPFRPTDFDKSSLIPHTIKPTNFGQGPFHSCP